MKKNLLVVLVMALIFSVPTYFLARSDKQQKAYTEDRKEENEEEEKTDRTRFHEQRMKYEFDMLKDPKTGKIPYGIRELERAFARTLPVRGEDMSLSSSGSSYSLALNTYIPAGPNNIGGRTRAVVYDRRYNGSSNRVIIAGSVSGGMMRSADGGITWVRTSPENDIHNLTAVAQDPTNPDVWYAGGGEAYGNSTSSIGALYLGYGIWKSTNNGVSWSKLPIAITDLGGGGTLGAGVLEVFDNTFDFVHRIAVHPITGDVYIAGHRRIIRSTDGGASFRVVFEGTAVATNTTGQTEVVISNGGRIYIAFNGGYPDATTRGVWYSNTGGPLRSEWTRIAGGQTLGVDSVDNWRGNSASIDKRIVLALAPSNDNVGYAFYENGLSSDPPDLKPEADLFRFDVSGTTYTWSNRSANMPDIAGGNLAGSDPLTVQGGYDMEVAVKPNDPNTVFIGGTNLYRSTDGFSTSNNTAWIGGYNTNFTYGQYPNSHADIHRLVFNPSNPNVAICANDGGIQQTADISAGSVSWSMIPNYQTLQYYYVSIDPVVGRNNFVGGAQDNGVRFRDKTGILGTAAGDSNNHRLLFSADGAAVGFSDVIGGQQYVYESLQFGNLRRVTLGSPPSTSPDIKPANLTTASESAENEFGEFVTNFRVLADNTDDLFYVNFNRLFRTTSASTVTSSSGWAELTGVSQAVNPANPTGGRNVSIRALGFSRGPYSSNQSLYIGTTNGKIFRLNDPRNAAPSTVPADITPSGLSGNVQDISVNPNNDEEILAVVSNYNTINIYWTANAKAATPTWKNVEGNLTLPSIRSCMIVVKKDAANNPLTEYYVGTSVGLYSTTNLAAASSPVWQREGADVLNYTVVQSLSYRPGDNVLLVGTHGNGMYYAYTGTPNFTPNVGTGINPVTNDKNFIKLVAPTVTSGRISYQVGNMTGIKNIVVQLTNQNGQVVFRSEKTYQNSEIDLTRFSTGAYILSVYSKDNKYRHVQKIIKR